MINGRSLKQTKCGYTCDLGSAKPVNWSVDRSYLEHSHRHGCSSDCAYPRRHYHFHVGYHHFWSMHSPAFSPSHSCWFVVAVNWLLTSRIPGAVQFPPRISDRYLCADAWVLVHRCRLHCLHRPMAASRIFVAANRGEAKTTMKIEHLVIEVNAVKESMCHSVGNLIDRRQVQNSKVFSVFRQWFQQVSYRNGIFNFFSWIFFFYGFSSYIVWIIVGFKFVHFSPINSILSSNYCHL